MCKILKQFVNKSFKKMNKKNFFADNDRRKQKKKGYLLWIKQL